MTHVVRPQGNLPRQLDENPKGHMNAIILRSEKQLDEPKKKRVSVWPMRRVSYQWRKKLTWFMKIRSKASMKKS